MLQMEPDDTDFAGFFQTAISFLATLETLSGAPGNLAAFNQDTMSARVPRDKKNKTTVQIPIG